MHQHTVVEVIDQWCKCRQACVKLTKGEIFFIFTQLTAMNVNEIVIRFLQGSAATQAVLSCLIIHRVVSHSLYHTSAMVHVISTEQNVLRCY